MGHGLITDATVDTSPSHAPPLSDTLIIGLGNPLRGDDGVGVRVAEALQDMPLPDGVEVVDGGTQGLGLVPLLQGRRRLVLIDAAEMGREPGQFVRFGLDEARLLGDNPSMAIHEAGTRDVLLMAQALNLLPEQVVIFGVQPTRIDWTNSLSAQVEAILPDLVRAVLEEAMGPPAALLCD
jgi:hydrogenase maturation protease